MLHGGVGKIVILIDGANIWATAKQLRLNIDFKKVLRKFAANGTLVRALYYTALPDTPGENVPIRTLVDYLDYNGFQVITKPTKEFVSDLGVRKIKGNMDINIAVDAMEMARMGVDRIVLMSGDGDFRPLVEALQRQLVHVTVVSTCVTKPSMIADELRRQADKFIDLDEIRLELDRND